jgi:hypothetical protein
MALLAHLELEFLHAINGAQRKNSVVPGASFDEAQHGAN